MSRTTDRLTQLFPEAYSAREPGSLLYRVLDAIGAELEKVDEATRALLKSHWINYASGAALDGLGSIFGVTRRLLSNGEYEPDEAFRLRLRSVVPLFTGGGTRPAVVGAVRSALGLPFNLADLRLGPQYAALQAEIEALVRFEEFSPKPEEVADNRVTRVTVSPGVDAHEVILVVDVPLVFEEQPRITWTFTTGAARFVSVELKGTGKGVASKGSLFIPQGSALILSTRDAAGTLSAAMGSTDVSDSFTALDGVSPARLPAIPLGRSEWVFRARGSFDTAVFDVDTFDLPSFRVQLQWQRRQPLSFDVIVPYFLKQTVEALAQHYGYKGDVLVYEGIPRERLQEVVNDTRAAGVKGSVHFSLRFFDDLAPRDTPVQILGQHTVTEDTRPAESLTVGSLQSVVDSQDLKESFGIGAVHDVATFDGVHVFTNQ